MTRLFVMNLQKFILPLFKNNCFCQKKENKPVFLNQLQVRQKWARWIGLPDTKKHWQFINTLCLFFLLFVDFVATLRHQCHLVSELQNSAKSQPFEFLELSSGFGGFVSVCSEWFWHTQFGIFLRQKYDDCDMFQQATTSRSVPKVIWQVSPNSSYEVNRSLWSLLKIQSIQLENATRSWLPECSKSFFDNSKLVN